VPIDRRFIADHSHKAVIIANLNCVADRDENARLLRSRFLLKRNLIVFVIERLSVLKLHASSRLFHPI